MGQREIEPLVKLFTAAEDHRGTSGATHIRERVAPGVSINYLNFMFTLIERLVAGYARVVRHLNETPV